jgi:hypothetical protein
VRVASADPSFVPAAAPPAAPPAPNPNVAKVTAALGLSPSTVADAQYPSPLQTNTGIAVPGALNIPGMPAVAPMSPQAPVPFTGQPGFVSPQAAAPVAVAKPAAAWAKPAPAPATVDEEDTPPNATPTQGVSPAVVKVAGALAPGATAPPSVAPVTSGIQNVNPNVFRALTSPYSDDATKKIAGIILQQQMTPTSTT